MTNNKAFQAWVEKAYQIKTISHKPNKKLLLTGMQEDSSWKTNKSNPKMKRRKSLQPLLSNSRFKKIEVKEEALWVAGATTINRPMKIARFILLWGRSFSKRATTTRNNLQGLYRMLSVQKILCLLARQYRKLRETSTIPRILSS